MDHKKLTMKKVKNPNSSQMTYSKRKDLIVQKADELSVLCDTDVALLMFPPNDQVTCFASNGRVEDTLLRFVDQADDLLRGGPLFNKEYLSQRLKQLKREREMLEKIAKIEALEEKLDNLKKQQREAQEKMRFYNPNVEEMNSVLEVEAYQQYISSAIQRIELSKATAVNMEDIISISDGSECSNKERNLSREEHNPQETGLPMGPHLSLSFLQSQKKWNLAGGDQAPY